MFTKRTFPENIVTDYYYRCTTCDVRVPTKSTRKEFKNNFKYTQTVSKVVNNNIIIITTMCYLFAAINI